MLLGVCCHHFSYGHHFVIIIRKESSKSFGRLWNLANLVDGYCMHPALSPPALDEIEIVEGVGNRGADRGQPVHRVHDDRLVADLADHALDLGLVRRPAHTLAPQVVATLGSRARLIVGGRWVGKRDDVGAQRVTLRPYTRVNLSGEYAIGSVVLSGGLENAFNDQAQEINGYRPRGRTVMVGGRVTVGR